MVQFSKCAFRSRLYSVS